MILFGQCLLPTSLRYLVSDGQYIIGSYVVREADGRPWCREHRVRRCRGPESPTEALITHQSRGLTVNNLIQTTHIGLSDLRQE
jgi:hypothetical protein